MNQGVKFSKGDWLYFMGSDDKLYNNTVLYDIFNQQYHKKWLLIVGKIKYDFKKKDSFTLKKNDGIVKPSWSNRLWIKNTLPHQAIFYRRKLFLHRKYSKKYKILADYHLNLSLFKNKINARIINNIVAICDTGGISKNYSWKLYKEEIDIKTQESKLLYKPFFIVISLTKYFLKKIQVL